ncbi:MAG: hypothetical protein KAG34_01065 [Cocleimonas sp.]|nr:hypothetical protein [Cocleimonas sp.]
MNNIQKRHVFYLSGFDPRGASFYHRVFKEEAMKQSNINKIKVDIGARKKHSKHSQLWKIEAQDQGEYVSTQYEFLCWDDIIRQHWVKSFWSIFIDFIYVSWIYITTGTLKRVANVSRTPAITGLYPAVYIAISGLLAILLCYASLAIFSAFNLTWLGWLIGLILFSVFIYSAKIIGDRINVFWLLRIYAFTARWASGEIKSIDQRIEFFADKIFATLHNNQQDEVIIVSHSVGTMLAVAIAARVTAKIDNHQVKLQLNMITLGECIPLLSLLPKAQAIKDDLAYLSSTENLYWIDYTSPADGACFPLVDPVKISIPEQQLRNSPLLLSARFYKLYTDAHYQKIKRNFYKMHFLYLMSHDNSGEYDLYAMIMGRCSLKERINKK